MTALGLYTLEILMHAAEVKPSRLTDGHVVGHCSECGRPSTLAGAVGLTCGLRRVAKPGEFSVCRGTIVAVETRGNGQ